MRNFIHKHKLLEIGLISIAFTIPYWMLFNNISIILTLAVSLFYFKKEQFSIRSISPINLMVIFLFLLMLISLTYSENLDHGLKKIEQRMLFVLIPIIIYLSRSVLNKLVVRKILFTFLLATVLGCLICLFFACFKTYYYASPNPFNEVNGNFFSYFKLTEVLDIHPIYFGTYTLFSLAIIFQSFLSDNQVIELPIFIRLIMIILLGLFTFLLNSFILLISLIAIIFVSVYVYFVRKKGKKWLILFLILLSFIPTYYSSYFVREKLKGINIGEDLMNRDFSGENFTALRARIAKATGSIDVIENNFWLGVGVGDEKAELMNSYAKINFQHGIKNQFNSHNQFLTEFIYTGFLGAVILILLFISIFKISLKKKDYLLFSLGIIYALFCLTESALVRNKGIVFFVFFATLLSQYHYRLLPKNVSLSK